MNDTQLHLHQIQTEASRQRAAVFARLVLATGRFVARPFRRAASHAV
ncbi:hypothetical protein [Aliiruegeria lutimaris]|uniref:Uncharacterized protein n=1 Tax=Aliiruegeria lutimaris TaxID=571298 RepID=A0A1G9CEV6_9RHOB|nr:hypothetical protein [Aliiruegeria lutimaris]SDK50189.1 hypothetical protein SAMN04488026_104320 [Aliiruegeria lutimaris]